MRRAVFEGMEVEVNLLTRRSWNCWWKQSSSGVSTGSARCIWLVVAGLIVSLQSVALNNGGEMCFTSCFHPTILQAKYVRPTSHGKAWIPVAELCPWLYNLHLDGRVPLSGESIAEILVTRRGWSSVKLCTSKVASAAINRDWGGC